MPGSEYSLGDSAEETRAPREAGVAAGPVAYRLPERPVRLELTLNARVSTREMTEELERLAHVLWTVGISALGILGLALALLIRWQLAPLTTMAREASKIGPDSPGAHIAAAGSAAEYVRLREALNQMLQRLASALERERNFASMAAHELRTPLAQLRTGLELTLRRERQTQEYQTAAREALSDVARLEGLVAGLLELARIGSPETSPPRAVSLREVVRQAARSSGAAEPARQPPDADVLVEGDPELLATALRNVLENALRYAPRTPPEVVIQSEPMQVSLVVSDAGPGVPEADRERIFEPLTRLDPSRTIGASTQGFGLGLAIARAAIRACKGELFCRARADGKRGAEFVFVLRRAGAIEDPVAGTTPASSRIQSEASL